MKSLRNTLILSVFFILTGCGSSGGGDTDNIRNDSTTRSITGAWIFEYPDTQCEEVYFFNSDSTFEINSADEIVVGEYIFETNVPGTQRHQLTIDITADNLQQDCSGIISDETGFAFVAYIEFLSDNEIGWYDDQTDGELLITMETFIGSPNSIRSQVNAGVDVQHYEREEITLTGSSDLTNVSSVQWSQLSGPSVDLSANTGFELTLTLPSVDVNESITLHMEIELDNGERLSDSVNVLVMDYMNIENLVLDDTILLECIRQTASSQAAVEVSDISTLSCDGVSNLSGIDQFVSLTHLQLPNNALSSLDSLLPLEHLVELDIAGNNNLPCSGIDDITESFGVTLTLIADDECVDSRPIELGDIGFDTAIDHERNQIYVSVPTRNEIVVISTTQLRIVDRLVLPGSPYGIDLSIDGTRIFAALRGTTSVASIDIEQREVEIIPLADKTGHPDTYDVIEGAPGQLFVSASPDGSGFGYIAKIDLEEFNLATRVADSRIIDVNPRFARSPDFQSLYLSEGAFSDSLYKLNLNDSDAGIILEDDYGRVSGTYNMSVNLSGSRIALASGQVLRTGSFIEQGRVTAGISAPSQISNTLFVVDTDATIQVFDFETLEQQDAVTTECTFGDTSRITPFNNDNAFALLQADVICLHGNFSRSELFDEFEALRFEDLGLEECVIDTATALGITSPEDIEILNCSASQTNILSLTSIDRLENLRQLNLSGHSVFSLSPLESLTNLEALIAHDSVVSNLAPLLGITTLTSIDLSGNARVSCSELNLFQANGVTIIADECTDHARIELGGIGADMEYDSIKKTLFVSIPSLQRISKIDIETAMITDTYTFSDQPRGIDLSTDRSTLYIALNGLGDIAYLDTVTGTLEMIDISTELGDDRTWDIAEVSPERILVSSNASSNGSAHIVEVRRDESNLASRVADNRIIRAAPTFATSTNSQFVYVGEGFSPNSLYKLDANDAALPIILEDNHGSVYGTSHLTLNDGGSLIYLSSGQVLSTSTFNQVAEFPSGKSWLSLDGSTLFIAEGETDAVGLYDVTTTAKIGHQEWGCEILDVQTLQEVESGGVIAMGDDLVCFTRIVPFE